MKDLIFRVTLCGKTTGTMSRKDLRIVFMGTPEFAVASLKALIEGRYNVVGVITAPDKPAGRGYRLQASAVKEYALSQGLPVLQPESLKNEVFLNELRALKADVQVVVAFRMLPEAVWKMPPKRTFNLHASLLPQYRGAAPINWAIINGEKETGITTFFLSHEIDTGEIIFQEKIGIDEGDNAETVHDKLMMRGSELVIKTIDAIASGSIAPKPQSLFFGAAEELKPAPKIFRETCRIDWDGSGRRVYDFIRGLSPYPAAWTELQANGTKSSIKIFAARFIAARHRLLPGEIRTDNKTSLQIAVQDGFMDILELQISGKKRTNIRDFLNGFSVESTAESRQ